jgi:ADP-ribosyl-[dinitrogen reductase] hydrolase
MGIRWPFNKEAKQPLPEQTLPTPALRDRYRGALLGLAAGDAVGTTHEFSDPGSFEPATDMVGGGPFGLTA